MTQTGEHHEEKDYRPLIWIGLLSVGFWAGVAYLIKGFIT